MHPALRTAAPGVSETGGHLEASFSHGPGWAGASAAVGEHGFQEALPLPFQLILLQRIFDKDRGEAGLPLPGWKWPLFSCQEAFHSSIWMTREHYLKEILRNLSWLPFFHGSSFQMECPERVGLAEGLCV